MLPIVILAIDDDDDRAFMSDLFISYERLMMSELLKILNNVQDAEDLMQTVLLKLIDKIPLLRTFNRKRTVCYIIASCRNTAITFLKKQKKVDYFSFDDDSWTQSDQMLCTAPSVEDEIIRQELTSSVKDVWDFLDPRDKFILEGKYLLDKSMQELAEDLEIKPESIRMALTRARRHFRDIAREKLVL